MPNLIHHDNNLIGQTRHGTQIQSSPTLGSSNSLGITTNNNHDVVNVNLALNSAIDFPSQSRATPMSGHHSNDFGLRRSNPNFGLNDISNSNPNPTQNTLNINVFMGNNSSINLNFGNNNIITSFNHETPVTISYLGENAVGLSPFQRRASSILGQNTPCQPHGISPSFLRLPSSRYLPYRRNNDDYSVFQGSTMNSIEENFLDFARNNDKTIEHELHPQQSLQSIRKTHPNIDMLPQVASEDETQISIAEVNNHGSKFQHHLPTQNHPYIRNGPYSCRKCEDTFTTANSYAAHVQKHYKGESPYDRKKRRQSKFRSKDLHISHSSSGLTVMPGALQFKETMFVNSNGGTNSNHNQGETSSSVKIKEEIKTEPF
ncbi:hypothetical protein RND81_14G061800 [Saponaria officinalis]|uniref:C2H2-type domain-containing protein n=1 Tax=Saponaria officinalis TaxID=3572 RepID=A0AAW1GIX8_SAPOF